MKEHKHAELLRAIADGKDVHYKYRNSIDWYEINDDNIAVAINNLTEWRTKPELKQVDYQALIDTKVLVAFTIMHYGAISRLTQVKGDNYYIDAQGNAWGEIAFEEGLKQVVSASTYKKLVVAGFDVKEILSYSDDSDDDEQVVIILEGTQQGYTL